MQTLIIRLLNWSTVRAEGFNRDFYLLSTRRLLFQLWPKLLRRRGSHYTFSVPKMKTLTGNSEFTSMNQYTTISFLNSSKSPRPTSSGIQPNQIQTLAQSSASPVQKG